jgi:hypothetical protein
LGWNAPPLSILDVTANQAQSKLVKVTNTFFWEHEATPQDFH